MTDERRPDEAACVVLSTAPNLDQAEALARAVIEERLAACVQLMPIRSLYRWQGAVQADDEVLMLFKARDRDFAAIRVTIERLHAYDTPEILKLGVDDGSARYLSWLFAETNRSSGS